MLAYILLVLGFVFTVKGAQLLIDGSSYLAQKIGLSPFIVGATVVAFGTSMPELAINLVAIIEDVPDIGLATLIGSTISTVLITGAVAALIRPLPTRDTISSYQLPLAGGLVAVLLILANDFFITDSPSVISRLDGFALIAIFAIGIYHLIGQRATHLRNDFQHTPKLSLVIALSYIVIGVAGLIIGGDWVVEGAVRLAQIWGISTPFIGLTIVAIGANLPEIVTAFVGSLRRNTELVIGNIFGSIIFNLGAVVGLIALIGPITFNPRFNTSIVMALIAIAIFYAIIILGKKRRSIERVEGLAMICIYLIYLVVVAVEG